MSTEGAEEEAGGRVGWGLQAFIPTWRQGRGDAPPQTLPASRAPFLPEHRTPRQPHPHVAIATTVHCIWTLLSQQVYWRSTALQYSQPSLQVHWLLTSRPGTAQTPSSYRYLSRYSRTFSDSTQPSSSCLRIALICRTCSRIFSARGSSMRSAIPWTT